MDNRFLDRSQHIDIHVAGTLPHWNQNAKIQFITFRLFDSLPQEKIRELKQMRDEFFATHPKPWDQETTSEYWKLISPAESKLLDNGYGSCLLRHSKIRNIVSESIRMTAGGKYDLIAYVIMPNHLHILLHVYEGIRIEEILSSIKRYTAKQINLLLNRKGKIWMNQYFDRIIRSEAHLHHCLNYIKDNPKHLPANDYELYFNPTLSEK